MLIPPSIKVTTGINAIEPRILPIENPVYPYIAPWTACWASFVQSKVSAGLAATDLIAYVGSINDTDKSNSIYYAYSAIAFSKYYPKFS